MGRPLLRYNDVTKRDLQSALIDTSAWEEIVKHRDTWWQSVKAGVSKAEVNARVLAICKRAVRKERAASVHDSTRHVCTTCNRDCHSRIALQSYKIPPKSPALTIASSRRGCHYYYYHHHHPYVVPLGSISLPHNLYIFHKCPILTSLHCTRASWFISLAG